VEIVSMTDVQVWETSASVIRSYTVTPWTQSGLILSRTLDIMAVNVIWMNLTVIRLNYVVKIAKKK